MAEISKFHRREILWLGGPNTQTNEVALLSGRRCHLIYPKEVLCCTLAGMLDDCAKLLDLDADQVARRGTLMHGVEVLRQPYELEAHRVHQLTLVMS